MVGFIADEKKADIRFVEYLFRAARESIQNQASGSVQDNINLETLRRLRFHVPDIFVQQQLADILSSLDDKIELNRRMNATLEAMAQALFKSWFVDFDPVKAKAAGRAPAGMEADTAALFPSEFVESELGLIPKGWGITCLGDHVELQRGNTYKSKLKDLPGPYLLGLGSIQRNGGFRDDSLRTYGGESPPHLLLKPGDLFASLKDVTQAADLLGAVARVPPEVTIGRLTQDTVKLVNKKSGLSRNYLYWILQLPQYRDYCRARATGTTNLGLSREDFLSYPIIVPSDEIPKAFDSVAIQADSLIDANRQESKTLAMLRDTLLPKLISGQLRIPEAEAMAEAAL